MKKLALLSLLIVTSFGMQPAFAHSASYHAEKLQLQAKAFLKSFRVQQRAHLVPRMHGQENPDLDPTLQDTVQNPTWSSELVREDLEKLVEVSAEVKGLLANPSPEDFASAKSKLDSVARRLRVSSAAASFTESEKLNFQLVMLELEETERTIDESRQTIANQQSQRRSRNRVNIGLGFGGGWGGPWGGWGGGFSPFYGNRFGWGGWGGRRIFRRGFRRGCR